MDDAATGTAGRGGVGREAQGVTNGGGFGFVAVRDAVGCALRDAKLSTDFLPGAQALVCFQNAFLEVCKIHTGILHFHQEGRTAFLFLQVKYSMLPFSPDKNAAQPVQGLYNAIGPCFSSVSRNIAYSILGDKMTRLRCGNFRGSPACIRRAHSRALCRLRENAGLFARPESMFLLGVSVCVSSYLLNSENTYPAPHPSAVSCVPAPS